MGKFLCWAIFFLLILHAAPLWTSLDMVSAALPPVSESSEQNASQTGWQHTVESSSREHNGSDQEWTEAETEVMGFSLQGKQFWHRVNMYDLDVLVNHEGRHYLPFLRLLRILGVEHEIQENLVVYSTPHVQDGILDLDRSLAGIEGDLEPVQFIEALSDISLKREIYLPPERVAEILDMDISWEPQLYEYVAETERFFPVWQTRDRESLLAVQTRELEMELPERRPPAEPEERFWALDFVQTRARINYQPVDQYYPDRVVLDSLEQTFWGNLVRGRYLLRISQPAHVWNDPGYSDTSFDIKLNRVEWTKDVGSSRFWLGDSTFGLNDIVFPTVQMTGLRFDSRLRSASPDLKAGIERSQQRYQSFEGMARVGSTVELYVNERLIETEEVYIPLSEDPELGLYQFPAVSLAPGSLNTIKIVVTEPDGTRTVTEKKIVATDALLRRGNMALLGGVGANRDFQEWSTSGFFSGGRFQFGLTDSITLGSTAAYQQDFYDPVYSDYAYNQDRDFPLESSHLGMQLAWQPFSRALAMGDFAFINAKEELGQEYSDWGSYLDLYLFPASNNTLHSRYFLYQPDFFDGTNRTLQDRTGYVVHGNFELHPKLNLVGAYSHIQDNVQGQRPDTLSAEIARAELRTGIIPKTRLGGGVDRLYPDWEDEAKNLYFMEMNSHLLPRLNIHGYHSTGQDIFLSDKTDFFQGLRLPGISLWETRHTTGSVSTHLSRLGTLRANYRRTETRERVSGIHSMGRIGGIPLHIRTELGRDLTTDQFFADQRCHYRFRRSQGTHLGVNSRYESQEWRVGVFLSVTELFRRDRFSLSRVEDRRINPDMGGIYGKVFVDSNVDYQLGPDEPGVEGVSILLNGRVQATTDADGSFMLPYVPRGKSFRVSLDPDTVPAIYNVVHGIQTANQEQGKWTQVNLAVAPVHSITGKLLARDEKQDFQPVSGVRVTAVSQKDPETVVQSITAGDGSFYLDQVRPGEVIVSLDPDTLPGDFVFPSQEQRVRIPLSPEPQDIRDLDFLGSIEGR